MSSSRLLLRVRGRWSACPTRGRRGPLLVLRGDVVPVVSRAIDMLGCLVRRSALFPRLDLAVAWLSRPGLAMVLLTPVSDWPSQAVVLQPLRVVSGHHRCLGPLVLLRRHLLLLR